MTINLKAELERSLKGRPKVKCANVQVKYDCIDMRDLPPSEWEDIELTDKVITLAINKPLEDFLNQLDIEVAQWGSNAITGTIFLEDGSWLQRMVTEEYAWWQHIVIPEIPKNLF